MIHVSELVDYWMEFLESELASALYCDEVLDGSGKFQYLDKVGSVSATEDRGQSHGRNQEKGGPSGPLLRIEGGENRQRGS